MNSADTATYVGHATVLVELDGTRLLTDPVLRARVGPLVRHGASPAPATTAGLDAVLISHLHHDHADLASLRRLDREVPLLVPPGSRGFFERRGFGGVTELAPGESAAVGALTVTAVEAHHDGGRRRLRRRIRRRSASSSRGGGSIYFAGDTDFFAAMEGLAPALDLALLPIWGWGPSIGDGPPRP